MAWPTHGERFNVDFGSEDEVQDTVTAPRGDFISDIKERSVSAPRVPSAPSYKNQTTGFPAHKKRVSKFASRHQAIEARESTLPAGHGLHLADATANEAQQAQSQNLSFEEREKQEIDVENTQKLAQMSDVEIEEARAELLSSLNPALVEKLLRRANIDDDRHDTDFPSLDTNRLDTTKQESSRPPKKVSFQDDTHQDSSEQLEELTFQSEANNPKNSHIISGPDQADSISQSLNNPNQAQDLLNPPSIHFPHASKAPDLDPSSPSFLSDLHSKYFPSLSHDPSKLSWMTESSGDTASNSASKNSYSPDASSLAPAEIRFSFTGALIPPRVAHDIPVTKGLHHHGEAPDAAGYTIGELAILARSTWPGQRCIGYSVLGKVLFRLGKGEFGDTMAEELVPQDENGEQVDDVKDEAERIARGKGELARGLWQVMHDEHVIDILTAAASDEGEKRHVTAKAYAQEAVWLWRRGGGRRWKAE